MPWLLTVVTVLTALLVAAAIFVVLWRERRTTRDAWISAVCGIALVAWAAVVAASARTGWFEGAATDAAPRVGVVLGLALLVIFAVLAISPSLRRMLAQQPTLIRLHVWRLFGVVFLALMVSGELPPVFALPAGIGDILIGLTAPWVARTLDAPGGRRRAIVFNLLGVLDLIVAAGVGIMTNPGPANLIDAVPGAEVMSRFPMALVPAFLVPLALTLHAVSLWQLFGGSWKGTPSVGAIRRPG